MNIILTGLRGSGKTQLGKILAKKLGWAFIDLDDEIEKESKMKIAKIVELKGWKHFRAKESKIVEKYSSLENTVLSPGGGAILDKDNQKIFKKTGKIIYLYRKPEDCCQYIKNDPNRPPLTNQETLEEEMNQLYKDRNNCYCKSSNIIFHRTDDLERDAEEIIEKLGLK